jgi:hypothetical protein
MGLMVAESWSLLFEKSSQRYSFVRHYRSVAA